MRGASCFLGTTMQPQAVAATENGINYFLPRPVIVWDIENVRLPVNCPAGQIVEAIQEFTKSKARKWYPELDVEPIMYAALNKKAQHRMGDDVLDALILADVMALWSSQAKKGSQTDDLIKRVGQGGYVCS